MVPDWTERLTKEERDSFWLAHRQHLRVERYAGPKPITELNRQFANAFRTIAVLRALVEEKDKALEQAKQACKSARENARWNITPMSSPLEDTIDTALSLTEDDMRKRLEEK